MEQDSAIEWVDVVDENNDVIGQATREQMRAENLRHRATYIVVHDGMGKILVQRRTEHKDYCPGLLDATAGGVVQQGELMLDSARAKQRKNSGSPVCRLPNTVCFIMKSRSAVSGAGYSAV